TAEGHRLRRFVDNADHILNLHVAAGQRGFQYDPRSGGSNHRCQLPLNVLHKVSRCRPVRIQPNGVATLVVAEYAFRALFAHESVSQGLEVRGQHFTLPALMLCTVGAWLGFLEECGNLDSFPDSLAGNQGQQHIDGGIDPEAPENAMSDLVKLRPEQGCRAGPAPAEQTLIDQCVTDPAC